MHFELPINAKVDLHSHIEEEEMYYVLSGRGEVIINDELYIIEPNDLLYIPKNSQHSLQNNGTEVLILLAIFTSPDVLSNTTS